MIGGRDRNLICIKDFVVPPARMNRVEKLETSVFQFSHLLQDTKTG